MEGKREHHLYMSGCGCGGVGAPCTCDRPRQRCNPTAPQILSALTYNCLACFNWSRALPCQSAMPQAQSEHICSSTVGP